MIRSKVRTYGCNIPDKCFKCDCLKCEVDYFREDNTGVYIGYDSYCDKREENFDPNVVFVSASATLWWYVGIGCPPTPPFGTKDNCNRSCKSCWLTWLKQEAKKGCVYGADFWEMFVGVIREQVIREQDEIKPGAVQESDFCEAGRGGVGYRDVRTGKDVCIPDHYHEEAKE